MGARAFVAAAVIVGAAPGQAGAETDRPETSTLVWAGLGFAVPTYFIGVVAHEGSHAVAAEAVGGDVVELHLLPGVRHGHFYFGYVQTRGLLGPGDRVWFYIAPKLVDATMLGAYAAVALTDSLPDNAYAALGVTVLATGFWVDFSKDIPAFWRHSDIVKLYDQLGATNEWRRLPLRLLHAGLSAAAAIAIVQGYREVFDPDQDAGTAALVVPLALGTF